MRERRGHTPPPDSPATNKARRVVLRSPLVTAAGRVVLDDETAHYVGRVLRLPSGVSIEAIDGTGTLWSGRLIWEDGVALLVDVEAIATEAAEAPLVLAAALIKHARWEWLVEKACELGATQLQPLTTRLTVVRPDEARADRQVQRWQRISEEAARQCQRLAAMEVLPVRSLAELLGDQTPHQLVFLDETDRGAGWQAVDAHGPLVMCVGPEGGWTDDERAALGATGVGVGLGRHVLRTETAGQAVLSGVRLVRDGLLFQRADPR